MIALSTSLLPFGVLRKYAYAGLLGYRFGKGTKIGFRTVLAVDHFECGEHTVIMGANRFIGRFSVSMGRKALIGRENQFFGSEAAASAAEAHKNYKRTLILGDDVLINNGHIFDIIGKVEIGDGTWVAGFRSQFLTHGAGVQDRDITIGANSFIGSSVLVSPGSSIGDDTIVAMGSVVTHKFVEPNVILAGTPAKILRGRSPDDEHEFSRVWE